jgi:hypothetical protein
MDWGELYPIVASQAYYSVLRYDPRRRDKVQELVCQSYEKYQNDVSKGKEIKKQEYKCFVNQRAKEVDKRSFVKKGFGGTSTTDALSFYRHRSDSGTEIVQYDEWMTSRPHIKERVEDSFSFNIDFSNWQRTLTKMESRILKLLLNGFTAPQIAKKIKLSYLTVREKINCMKTAFIRYFHITNNKPLPDFG